MCLEMLRPLSASTNHANCELRLPSLHHRAATPAYPQLNLLLRVQLRPTPTPKAPKRRPMDQPPVWFQSFVEEQRKWQESCRDERRRAANTLAPPLLWAPTSTSCAISAVAELLIRIAVLIAMCNLVTLSPLCGATADYHSRKWHFCISCQ